MIVSPCIRFLRSGRSSALHSSDTPADLRRPKARTPGQNLARRDCRSCCIQASSPPSSGESVPMYAAASSASTCPSLTFSAECSFRAARAACSHRLSVSSRYTLTPLMGFRGNPIHQIDTGRLSNQRPETYKECIRTDYKLCQNVEYRRVMQAVYTRDTQWVRNRIVKCGMLWYVTRRKQRLGFYLIPNRTQVGFLGVYQIVDIGFTFTETFMQFVSVHLYGNSTNEDLAGRLKNPAGRCGRRVPGTGSYNLFLAVSGH